MTLRRKLAAAAAFSLVLASGAFAQEQGPESIETVGREFIGVLNQNGWKDARYSSIRGDGALFEIRGVKGTRKAGQSSETLEIDTLTVEALDPGDRWIRAESIRIDGLRTVVGGNEVSIGAIYAKKPGILDIDLGRPTASFSNAVLSNVSWSRGGVSMADLAEMYLSGDRWIGEFGVPGRLDVTAKGSVAASALSFLPPGAAAAYMKGEFAFKTSVSSTRDEMTIGASFSDGVGSWVASAVLTEFDSGLFRAWFDRENFDENRTDETKRVYAQAFDKEMSEVGLKSFEFSASGGGKAGGPVLDAVAKALPSLLPPAFSEAAQAFAAFAAAPKTFKVSGYARDAVPVVNLLSDGGAAFTKFSIRTGR